MPGNEAWSRDASSCLSYFVGLRPSSSGEILFKIGGILSDGRRCSGRAVAVGFPETNSGLVILLMLLLAL